MYDVTLTDHFQYHSHFLDIDNITLQDQRKKMTHITVNTYIITSIIYTYNKTTNIEKHTELQNLHGSN